MDGEIDSLGQSGRNQDAIFYRNQSSQLSQTPNKLNVSCIRDFKLVFI